MHGVWGCLQVRTIRYDWGKQHESCRQHLKTIQITDNINLPLNTKCKFTSSHWFSRKTSSIFILMQTYPDFRWLFPPLNSRLQHFGKNYLVLWTQCAVTGRSVRFLPAAQCKEHLFDLLIAHCLLSVLLTISLPGSSVLVMACHREIIGCHTAVCRL